MATVSKEKKKAVKNPCPVCGEARKKFFVPKIGRKMLYCIKCCEFSKIK
jgi:ribosomal protein S26